MLLQTFQKLKIPEKKDAVFTYPAYSSWAKLIKQNKSQHQKKNEQSSFGTGGDIANTAEQTKELILSAKNYTHKIGLKRNNEEKSENIIVTGHQATWHHCGILAKNCIASHLSKKLNGCAIHLILDHDISDTAMTVPELKDEKCWSLKKIEIEIQQNIPLEFRAVPSKEQIQNFINSISESTQAACCKDLWSDFSKKKQGKISSFRHIGELITYLQAKLNSALGIEMLYLPVSEMAQSRCFINFCKSIMENAPTFAHTYNNAIRKKTANSETKHPDNIHILKENNGRRELPFWLVSTKGRRSSLYVKSNNKDNIQFGTDKKSLGRLDAQQARQRENQLIQLLRKYDYRLRPKAVTLTLFTRLFLADWFIHGIGGAKYEDITNYVLEKYYKIKNLQFAVATTTMNLPLEVGERTLKDNPAELKQILRELQYNPERFIKNNSLKNKQVISLIPKKEKLIELAKNNDSSTEDKKKAWAEISKVNDNLRKFTEEAMSNIKKRITLSQSQKLSIQVLNYRKFFFGLFPRKSLENVFGINNGIKD